MRQLATLLLVLLAGVARAGGGGGCAPEIEQALRHVKVKAPIRGEVVSQDCRLWPATSQRVTAAVMAFAKPGIGDQTDQSWDVVIALVDATAGKLLSSHRTTLQEDATTLLIGDSLNLDLAPYLLKPGVRALGLRFSSARNASAANSQTGGALRLYLPEGPRLRPVFCQAMGWQDAGLGVIGQDAWDEAQTTLSVLNTQTSGWHDLRLTDRISHNTPDGKVRPPKPSYRECRVDGSGVYRCTPPKSEAITACDPAGL